MLWGYKTIPISNPQRILKEAVYLADFKSLWVDNKVLCYVPHENGNFLGIINQLFFIYLKQNVRKNKGAFFGDIEHEKISIYPMF